MILRKFALFVRVMVNMIGRWVEKVFANIVMELANFPKNHKN